MDDWVAKYVIEMATGPETNEKTRQSLRAEIEDFARGLAGDNPPPTVQALAVVAALNWFAMRTHEGQHYASLKPGKSVVVRQSEFAQLQIDRSHRRFLQTVKAIATIRRLAVPTLQINLAERQVDVVGGFADSSDRC